MTDRPQHASLPEMPLQRFLEQLGSQTPSPGGGTAAGVAGAIGTRLLQMTCRYSCSGETDQGGFSDFIDELEPLSDRFTELAEKDQRTYEAYRDRVDRFGIDDERAVDLLVRSTRIPLEMGECCREILRGYLNHRHHIKSAFDSDVRTAVHLFRVTWHASNDLGHWNLNRVEREPEHTELHEKLIELEERMADLFERIESGNPST